MLARSVAEIDSQATQLSCPLVTAGSGSNKVDITLRVMISPRCR